MMHDYGKQRVADYMARNMKQAYLNPHIKTEGLYVSGRKTMADMDDAYLRKQLCHMSGGDLSVCAKCAAPCTVGNLLLERRARA